MTLRLTIALLAATTVLLALWLMKLTRHAELPPGAQPVQAAKQIETWPEEKPSLSRPHPSVELAEDALDDEFAAQRRRLVEDHIRGGLVNDPRVIRAMQTVPRHLFVPEAEQHRAYGDHPLSIGQGQTISQPSLVALMTQLARPQPHSRALDIGTGSGYQAAILSSLVKNVYSIEILCELADDARERLQRLGYDNVEVRCGDGYRGWPEHAPFDVIIVAAAPDHVPQPLIEQLAVGGRLIIPVGDIVQQLIVIEKQPDGTVTRRSETAVRFVPMTGEAQRQ